MQLGKYDIRRDNIAHWPSQLRYGLLLALVIILLLLAYMFDFSRLLNETSKLKQKEATLKVGIAQKHQIAANLPVYKQQLQTLQNDLNIVIKQLPSEAEVPGLIEEISKLGQAEELSFSLLQPQAEVQKPFYVEFPLHIIVKGSYQQLYNFIVAMANMQRIISVGNFRMISDGSLSPEQPPQLTLDFTATTYRYALAKTEVKI